MTSNAITEFLEREGPAGDTISIEVASRLASTLYDKWSGGTVLSRLPEVITDAMKLVERIGKLSGVQKKRAVVGVVVELVDSWNIGGSMEPMLLAMIPVMIDTFVSVENGQMRIKKRSFGCLRL